MTEFTRNLEDLNQKHSILEESLAERLSAEFPQLEYAFSNIEEEDFASGISQATGDAKIIALLPLNDHPKVRSALEETFREITAKEGTKVVLDLDIASPHNELFGEENAEGLSDHFLYGISPKKVIRTSSRDPQLKILNAGTFTPQAAEIYLDPGWNQLIGWSASQADGPVVILGPPLERFSELAALEKADQVLVFTDPLDSETQGKLPDLVQKLSNRSSPQSSLRFIWLGGEEKTPPEEEITEKPPAEKEELPSLDEAETPEIESSEKKEEKPAAVSEEKQAKEEGLEDEKEIFLPEELLFLDDDEKQLIKAADDSSVSEEIGGYLDIDRLPGLTDMDKMKETTGEPRLEAEAKIEKAEPEAIEKTPEPVSVSAKGVRIESELGGDSQQEPETEETGPAEETEPAGVEDDTGSEEVEAEALYTQADEEDELEMKETAAEEEEPVTEKEVDQAALEKMKSFEEALNAPSPEEMELQLDVDPLGEAAGPEEDSAGETGSEEKVGEEAAEETPARETVEEAMEESPEEEAVEESPKEEAAEEISEEGLEELGEEELATLEESELEPVEEEGAVEAPAAEEIAPEAEAAVEEPVEEEAKEKALKEEAPAEEIAAAEEAEPEPVAAEGEAEAGAGQEPEAAGEEAAEEPVREKEAAEEKAEPVLEEIEEEGAVAEAAAVAEEKAEGAEGPTEEDIDELLSGAAELEDLSEGITLEDLGEPEAAEAAPRRVKKPSKRSRARPLVTVAVLLTLAAGMFFVWKQGTVSSFVRRLPGIAGVQSLIPSLARKAEEERALAEKARADSIRLAQEREAMLAAAQRYDKLEYSIQIGSYRFLAQAIAARNLLRENGLNDVYVVPLTLDSLGNWNRLYMGMFKSAEKADTALINVGSTLRRTAANFRMRGGAIRRHTPLALKIEEASSADSLENLIQRLEENNIPTYTVKLSADTTEAPVFRLYVGAFETLQQAVYMRTRIFNLGVHAEIIQREGTIEKKEG